jgi:hypothetical protein
MTDRRPLRHTSRTSNTRAIPFRQIRRIGLPRSIIFIAVLLASAVAGYVWLHERLASAPPSVRRIDPYTALFDLTPVTVTVTAGDQQVEWHTSIHEVRTDWTLWRRMHLADWNAVPETLRQEGLDNMLAKYRDSHESVGVG